MLLLVNKSLSQCYINNKHLLIPLLFSILLPFYLLLLILLLIGGVIVVGIVVLHICGEWWTWFEYGDVTGVFITDVEGGTRRKMIEYYRKIKIIYWVTEDNV